VLGLGGQGDNLPLKPTAQLDSNLCHTPHQSGTGIWHNSTNEGLVSGTTRPIRDWYLAQLDSNQELASGSS
jgi:hypothetical protein